MNLNNLLSGVTLTLPGWALAAAGLGVVILLILILRPRNDASGLGTLAQLALVAVVGGAAYFGLKQLEDSARYAERKAIEDRVVLLSQSQQPGSALACLNVAAAPALDEACERTIFAEPQRITAAISFTADRIALLNDATAFAAREPAFAERFEPLRKSLEADPYGIVAHVLASEHKCIPDSCARLRIFRDSDRIKDNLSKRTFDELLVKHRQSWARNPADEHTATVADILTLGIRPENAEALNWGQQDASQTPPAPFTPQAATPETATPVAARPAEPVPPAATTKQKTRQKQQPTAATEQRPNAAQKQQGPTQARRKGGPPEPVGGLPRVTARGSNPPADDDDDDTPPAAAPAPAPQPQRSPFGIFGR